MMQSQPGRTVYWIKLGRIYQCYCSKLHLRQQMLPHTSKLEYIAIVMQAYMRACFVF